MNAKTGVWKSLNTCPDHQPCKLKHRFHIQLVLWVCVLNTTEGSGVACGGFWGAEEHTNLTINTPNTRPTEQFCTFPYTPVYLGLLHQPPLLVLSQVSGSQTGRQKQEEEVWGWGGGRRCCC